MLRGIVWLPAGITTLGELSDVEVDGAVIPDGIRSTRVTVIDPAVSLHGTDLRCDHGNGGGPLADARSQRRADQFGAFSTLFHAERALTSAEQMLGRRLPRLTFRVGVHCRTGGGHYRLPAAGYAPEEPVWPAAHGEVHLGRGRRHLPSTAGRYYNAAAHNAAIIYHEVGHHLCRHTADFRLNDQLPATDQDNGKTPLDEGTSDYFTAVMLGHPDIFGWHRATAPRHSQQRRAVDGSWTMAVFRGGHTQDPHVDGTVWSSALWAARVAAKDAGATSSSFDAAVMRALAALGDPEPRTESALRRRRYLGRAAHAIIAEMEAVAVGVAPEVRSAFAARGILPGFTNAELRDFARSGTELRSQVG